MQWAELSLRCPRELADPLADLFRRWARGRVWLEEGEGGSPPGPVTICAYFPLDRSYPRRKARVDLGRRLLNLISPIPPLRERVVEEGEWLEGWREAFPPLRIGRLVVVPSWLGYTPAPGKVLVLVEPGMAFGTGHHPTTRLCLREVARHLRPGQKVVDLGTGSGILAWVRER